MRKYEKMQSKLQYILDKKRLSEFRKLNIDTSTKGLYATILDGQRENLEGNILALSFLLLLSISHPALSKEYEITKFLFEVFFKL